MQKLLIVIVFLITIILVFFPLFITFNVCYLSCDKKVFIGIYLFNIIPLFGGYVELSKYGIAIHYSSKKAKIIPYNSLLTFNKTIKPLKDYHIISCFSIIDVGTQDSMVFSSFLSFLYVWHNKLICNFFTTHKNYLKLNNSINLYEDERFFNIYLKLSFVLNFMMIILSLVKILWGKLCYGIRKQ